MPIPRHGGSHAPTPVTSARRAPEMRVWSSSRRTSPLVLDRTQNKALHVDATAGGGRSSETSRRISAKQNSGDGDLGHLEGDITAVADDVDGCAGRPAGG